jgi:hypothetical protein
MKFSTDFRRKLLSSGFRPSHSNAILLLGNPLGFLSPQGRASTELAATNRKKVSAPNEKAQA